MGRHTTFTPEKATEICEKLSQGIPLAVICREEGMPAVRTVSDWKSAHPSFAADFVRAREEGFDALAAQCIEIADDEEHDWTLTKKGPVVSEVAIGRARLQVDTRLKLLAKWYPAKYGEKVDVTTGGESMNLGADERAAKLQAIAAAAARRRELQNADDGTDLL